MKIYYFLIFVLFYTTQSLAQFVTEDQIFNHRLVKLSNLKSRSKYVHEKIIHSHWGDLIEKTIDSITYKDILVDSFYYNNKKDEAVIRESKGEYYDRKVFKQKSYLHGNLITEIENNNKHDYKYDKNNNMIRETDYQDGSREVEKEFTYNNKNKLVKDVDWPLWFRPWTTTYKYDNRGNLIRTTKSDYRNKIFSIILYEYDKQNNKLTYRYKDMIDSINNITKNYRYNKNGALVFENEIGNEKSIYYLYNDQELLTEVIEINDLLNVRDIWQRDALIGSVNRLALLTYQSKLIEIDSLVNNDLPIPLLVSRRSYKYDPNNRLIEDNYTEANSKYAEHIQYEYDSKNNLITMYHNDIMYFFKYEYY